MRTPILLSYLLAATAPSSATFRYGFVVPPPSSFSSSSSVLARPDPPTGRTLARDVTERYELSNRFERWNFLQKLLENELPPGDVEDVLLAVLSGYRNRGPKSGGEGGKDDPGEASPAWDDERREAMRVWMEEVSSSDAIDAQSGEGSRFLHHFVRPPVDCERESFRRSSSFAEGDTPSSIGDVPDRARSLLSRIEELLPHPSREEEAHKSAWDVIIELHGRESVRVNEEKLQRCGLEGEGFAENMEWKTLCCLGRVLIHYDFLTKGILFDEEEDETM